MESVVYERPYFNVVDSIRHRLFIYQTETLTEQHSRLKMLYINQVMIEFTINQVKSILDKLGYVTYFDTECVNGLIYQFKDALVEIPHNDRICIYGEETKVDAIYNTIFQSLLDMGCKTGQKNRYANYSFTPYGKTNIETHIIEMTTNEHFNEAAYPYIEGGAINKLEEFHNSSSPIMILLGEPGTGKTTFIREYIKRYTKSSPVIVYDEATASNESLYMDFLLSDSELIVFEDSDNLMSDRIMDNNKHMNKILNLSNGLLNIKKKKFIFSANLKDVDQIDHALTRPGRCFDTVLFRPLTPKEIRNISADFDFERSHTISEIFNNKQTNKPVKKQRVGFL